MLKCACHAGDFCWTRANHFSCIAPRGRRGCNFFDNRASLLQRERIKLGCCLHRSTRSARNRKIPERDRRVQHSERTARPSRSAIRRSARCISLRPQVSGAESPMDPKVASPTGGANAPRVSARAGSSEKRSGSPSHVASYSKRMISPPRVRLLLASPIRLVRPRRSIRTSKSPISRPPLEVDVLWQIGPG